MNPRKVELIKQAQNYQLTVDGKPFYIKGAGLDLGIDNIKVPCQPWGQCISHLACGKWRAVRT